jgi:hypothetical protein
MITDHKLLLEAYNSLFDNITVRRDEVLKFKEFLETRTSWLTSPASTRFHLNIERGLLIHSVGVALNAIKIKNLLAPDISDESITIVSLFHDIGKVGDVDIPYYLKNDVDWEIKKGIAYKTNPEIVTMSLGTRSLYLISQHVKLSQQEAQAIVAHDGLYPTNGGVNNLEYFHRECRLQMILHFADKWTAAVEEENRK